MFCLIKILLLSFPQNSLSKSQDVNDIMAACYSESSAAKSDPAVLHALKQELTNMKDDYEAVTKELSDPGREESGEVVDFGKEATEVEHDDFNTDQGKLL